MASASPPPKHTQLPHPLNQRSPEARAPQYPITESPVFNTSRAQPLPRTLPAPPISKHAADSAALDAATAAITKAGDNLDVGDTGLLNDLCERLSNPELYTRPITRQRIIELLEVACDEMAKTRGAGLWEITARVAQERHFVCPPQMEGTVKCYIKLIDTVNENSAAFEEEDLKARLAQINQSKPFQANIPANTACLFCRRRKIKCDGSLPQCDMCMKHRQAKCEYPQKSHYGGFSNRGGLHFVVPMGPDIAAAAASSTNGAPPPMLLELGKAVKGYAPPPGGFVDHPAPPPMLLELGKAVKGYAPPPTAAPTYILPGPAPDSEYDDEQASNAPRSRQDAPRRDSYTSSGPDSRHNRAGSNMSPPARRNSSATARPQGNGEKSWDGYPDEEENNRPMSSASSPILQDGRAHVEMEDGETPRRRSPHTGNERCINCDTGARGYNYNRDARAPLQPSPSVDMSLADATEDRHRGRRTSDEHRRAPEDDDETEVQAGENLCAVEGGRSPADVLVFRFDADRAKSVCATQWAHLRSPGRTVEDDLRFHLNCYRKNPPDSSSQERVTLGVATDWLPKAGVYSITSGDEPPTSHHMAPPPNGKLNQTIDITSEIREGLNTLKFTQLRDMSDCVLVVQIWKGKLNQTIDITSEIREGLNTLKFTQLRDMSDCVLVVQIWKVGRKSAGPQVPPTPTARHGNVMSPVDKHHSRAPPAPTASRGPPVYEASPSPGTGLPPRGAIPIQDRRGEPEARCYASTPLCVLLQ
ncbi:hypothetical protein RSAG8_02609, partial [Rhizoctonia solani AG-8 WAC10335]